MRTHTLQACRAKDPTTCRHHGNPKRAPKLSFTTFFNLNKPTKNTAPAQPPKPYGLTIRAKEEQYRDAILADINTNRKLRIDPKTGTKTVSIYRSGIVAAPAERGVEKQHYTDADIHAPAGRQGRTTGIFASANMDTALRWYRANGQSWSHIEDYGLREIRVNPDTTYIYSVSNWERASSALGDTRINPDNPTYQQAIKNFWAQSMTLTDWYQYVQDNPTIDTRDWEIIISADDAQKVSPVGSKRILDNSIRDWEKRDIEDAIKHEQKIKRDNRLYGSRP